MFLRWTSLRSFIIIVIAGRLSLSAEIQDLEAVENQNNNESNSLRFFPDWATIEIEEEGQQCSKDLRFLQQNAFNDSLWATMMLDATSAYPTGVLHGNRYHLGNFDSCMAAGRQSPVGARYCIARLSPSEKMAQGSNETHSQVAEGEKSYEQNLFMAVCVPESCHEKQIQQFMEKELVMRRSSSKLADVAVSPDFCSDRQSPCYTGLIVFSLGVAALVGLAALATLMDMKQLVSSTGRLRWILAWSVLRRWQEFWSPEKPIRGVPLMSLSAIRCGTLITIVIVHHIMQLPRTPPTMQFVSEKMYTCPLLTPITHPYVLLYSLFYFSGLFLALTATDSFFSTVILRYLRLTPSYMAVVAFYALAYKTLGSGPLWNNMVTPEADACANLWWTNVLYVNNYVRPHLGHGCIIQSWTLATDLQFCIVGTLLLIAFRRWRRVGLALIGAALALSMLAIFVTTLVGLREATWKFTPRVAENIWMWPPFRQYMWNEQWALPYLIGMCTGIVLERAVKAGCSLTSKTVWLLLPGAAGVMGVVIGSSAFWSYPGVSQNSFFAAVYATSSVAVWSICLAVVTAVFALGPRTWLSWWLELQIVVSFSRLTYSFYLVHYAFQMALVGLRRSPRYVSFFDIGVSSAVEIGMMVPACLALYFLLEAPIRELSKGLFKSKRSVEADLKKDDGDEKNTQHFNGIITYQNQKGSPNSGFNMGLIDEYK